MKEAKRWIFSAVHYPNWGHIKLVDVDLSASWLLFGLSICYDWLKEEFTDEEREKLLQKLILQGSRMYDFVKENDGQSWTREYWQNHNWINLNGLATVGYTIRDEYKNAEKWIDYTKENFENVFYYLPEDGSDYEGVSYWRYGVPWLFAYASLVKEKEGIDYFKTSGFLKNTFYYRLYQSAPNLAEIINFGDCHDRRTGHSVALYYKIASEYNNGHAQYLGEWVRKNELYREGYVSGVKPGLLPEAGLELLWYDPHIKEKSFADLPLVKYFDDLGLLVIRSSWDMDATHFSFKCSPPGGHKQWKYTWELDEKYSWRTRALSHLHPDNNSFIINAHGTYLAVDEGYCRNLYASDHNVILVDRKGYVDEGDFNSFRYETIEKDWYGSIEQFANENGYVYAVGETAKLYDKSVHLDKFYRHILYSQNGYFIILDELESSKDHIYTFLLHSDQFANQINDETFVIENGLGKMSLHSVYPSNKTIYIDEKSIKAIMTPQEPNVFRETKLRTLKIENSKKSRNEQFITVLHPYNSLEDNDIIVNSINYKNLKGAEIILKDSRELFLYCNDNSIEYEDVKSDGKWISLVHEKDKLLKCVMYDGTKLEVDNKKLIFNNKEKLFSKRIN